MMQPEDDPDYEEPAVDEKRAKAQKKLKAGQKRSSVNGILHFSLTVTPYNKKGGLEFADADRLRAVTDFAESLYSEMQMRKGDGQVHLYTIAVERGEENNNPHNQGFYEVLGVLVDDATAIKGEKAWIKKIWSSATALPVPRIELRIVRPRDALYLIGYCQKDEGMAHFYQVHSGIPAETMARAREFYRSNAGTISWTSKKMNKNPKAEEKQLSFKLGNKTNLVTWFVHQHEFDELHEQMTLAYGIALAIQSKRYRLDDEVLHGRNGAAALCPKRTQAMLQLAFLASKGPLPSVTVSLIETVLYGAPQVQSATNYRYNGPGLVHTPSTKSLVEHFDLGGVKALAKMLRAQAPTTTREAHPDKFPAHEHGGRYIVLDFLSHAKSKEAADLLDGTNLQGTHHFATSQITDACGYLAAGWVALLHKLGDMFHTLDFETADAINTVEFMKTANENLGYNGTDPNGKPYNTEGAVQWLTGDQVLQLVHDLLVPDPAPGIGPAPMNFWRATIDRHLKDPREWGKVHIMVVNTSSTYTLTEEGASNMSGVHWFVVAWWLNVEEADPGSASQDPPLPWEGD